MYVYSFRETLRFRTIQEIRSTESKVARLVPLHGIGTRIGVLEPQVPAASIFTAVWLVPDWLILLFRPKSRWGVMAFRQPQHSDADPI